MSGEAKYQPCGMLLGCRKAWNLDWDHTGDERYAQKCYDPRKKPVPKGHGLHGSRGVAARGVAARGRGCPGRGGAGLRRGSLTCGLGGPGAVRKFRKWVAVMVAHTTNWLRCKLTVRVLYYHKNDYNCSENVTFVSLVSFTAETGNSIV